MCGPVVRFTKVKNQQRMFFGYAVDRGIIHLGIASYSPSH
jgi:hypothetical protein